MQDIEFLGIGTVEKIVKIILNIISKIVILTKKMTNLVIFCDDMSI